MIAEHRGEAPAGGGLEQQGDAADRDRCPKGAGENAVVDRGPLHQGVGEQGVHHDPQDDMHRGRRRADAELARSDDAGDGERGDDREEGGYAGLESRPEGVTPHADRRRRAAKESTAMNGGSHMMRTLICGKHHYNSYISVTNGVIPRKIPRYRLE